MRSRLACAAFVVAFQGVASLSQNPEPTSNAVHRFRQDSAEVQAQNELKALEEKQEEVANESSQLDIRQQELDGSLKHFTEELRKAAEFRRVVEARFAEVQSTKSGLEVQLKKLHDQLSPAACGGAVRALTEEHEFRTKEVEWLQQKSDTLTQEGADLNEHIRKLAAMQTSEGNGGKVSDRRALLANLMSGSTGWTREIAIKQKSIVALEKRHALLEEQKTKFEGHSAKLQEIHNEVMKAQQINADLKQQKMQLQAAIPDGPPGGPMGGHKEELLKKLRVAQNATVGLDYNKVKFSGQLSWLNTEVAKLQWQAKHDFDILQQRQTLRKETHVMQAHIDQLREKLQRQQY